MIKKMIKLPKKPSAFVVALEFCKVNISTVHLDTLGMIHDFRLIAETLSLDIKKAGPFTTLPLSFTQ